MKRPSDTDDRRRSAPAQGQAQRPSQPSNRRPSRWLVLGFGLWLVPSLGLGGCQDPESKLTSPSSASGADLSANDAADSRRSRRRKTPTRTANPDTRTYENQPDYDAEAASLRDYVDPLLPSPVSNDPAIACEAMFTATDTFYAAIETSIGRREQVLTSLKSTRERDLKSCIAETSPTAAACVTLLIARRTAELPWLIDQCSRAYPLPAQ